MQVPEQISLRLRGEGSAQGLANSYSFSRQLTQINFSKRDVIIPLHKVLTSPQYA